MSTAPIEPRSSILKRLRFPAGVVLLGGGAWLFFHTQIDSEQASHNFAIGKALSILISLLLLTFWLYFGSGLRKSRVVIGVLFVVGVFFGLYRPKPDGSMYISFEMRRSVAKLLGISHDDDLNRERQQQQVNARTGIELSEHPGDWPEFRGKGRTGVYYGPPINLDWDAQPPKPLWRHLIGNGYASFVVANGYLVTIEQRLVDGEDREAVVCYEAKTGLEVWKCHWPGRFDELAGGPGPRATPTIHDGDVYAMGAMGRLVCIDGSNGHEKWAIDTLQNNANLRWAMSGAPLVHGDLVIVTPGTQTQESAGRAILAFDRKTGKEVWASDSNPGSYASPMTMTLDGVEQLLVFDGLGLGGYEIASGKELWRFPWTNAPRVNVAQPIRVSDNRVFFASGYDTGGALIDVSRDGDRWKVSEVWRTRPSVMRCKFTSPVQHEGFVYGLNDGYLECVDLAAGKQKWKDDRRRFRSGEAFGHGQIILAGKHLIALTEYGELVLVEANPEEMKEVSRFKVLDGKCWNNFALVGGVLYLRNDREMTAFDLRVES